MRPPLANKMLQYNSQRLLITGAVDTRLGRAGVELPDIAMFGVTAPNHRRPHL
jgi:hypothetical protein